MLPIQKYSNETNPKDEKDDYVYSTVSIETSEISEKRTRGAPLLRSQFSLAEHKDNEHKTCSDKECTDPIYSFIQFF